jgi:hypothetical protein
VVDFRSFPILGRLPVTTSQSGEESIRDPAIDRYEMLKFEDRIVASNAFVMPESHSSSTIEEKPLKRFWPIVILVVGLFAAGVVPAAFSAEFPKLHLSAKSDKPPKIDGKIGDEEWNGAQVVEFELPMLHFKSQKLTTRVCQWRVMNSANGLYIALRVPDATVNQSLAPLDFDFATLAFCQGPELIAGDDRKAVALGIYLDKHLSSPGKDVDDKQVDGKGAMVHDPAAGVYTMEWAIPLNSGDKEDIQAKPGDELKFNVAYIDAFQADLKETQIGSAYAGGLDVAKDWGKIRLATDVQDDGGAAFKGPEWVRKEFAGLLAGPAKRMRVLAATLLPAVGGAVAKVEVEYPFRDPRGKSVVGKGKFYIPASDETFQSKLPLYYSAGYELDDASALGLVARGFAVVTPQALEANPLVRTVNPDLALLHVARSLSLVDDSRVLIAGGSAGGYATLMVAAETFPISGAAPAVPPVNWGYNAAYFLQREQGDSRKDANAPKTPVFDVIVPIVYQGTKVYGTNPSDEIYFRHSPIAHLDTVTCPVLIYWTTADMLVPIDQVGKQWARPFDATKFPAGFTFDPEKLTTSPQGRVRFIDSLKPENYEIVELSEASIKEQLKTAAASKVPPELSFSTSKQWSITIMDEGAPQPELGHAKYAVPWSQAKFVAHVTSTPIAANQLTPTKLERLMDRYAGREWLPTELVHLDDTASEHLDVVRGLKTYVAAGIEHAKLFGELYGKLSADKRVLPEKVPVGSFSWASA